jgi:hypothetical protein
MRGRLFYGTAFVNKSPDVHIKMKATIAMWATFEMLLDDNDLLNAQLPVDIEMQTSCGLDAI